MSALTLNIPADGSLAQATLGRYQFAFVRVLSRPVEISFDGAQWQTVAQNDKFTRPEIPTRVFFRSTSGLSSLVTFQFSMTPFSAQDTAVSVDDTFALGCMGLFSIPALATAQKVGGGVWAVTSGVAVDSANGLFIPGNYQRHKRKQVTFENTTLNGNTSDLIICDTGGHLFARIIANNIPYTWETSSDFWAFGYGGATTAGSFIINEIYYAN